LQACNSIQASTWAVDIGGMDEPKPQYDHVREYVLARAAVWQQRLRLDYWEIEHVFLDSFFGDDGEEDFKVTAVTESRWNYFQAKIKWYLPSAVRHSDNNLDKVCLHECCHVLLSAEQGIPETATLPEDEWLDACAEKIELATEMTTLALWDAYAENDGRSSSTVQSKKKRA
jgi:hypothetical protein